jgi:hypothetical protein
MARAGKRIELRPVDDEVVREPEVVRLRSADTTARPAREEPVRLGPRNTQEATSRLEVAGPDERELRTHQPGIEALFDVEGSSLDSDEQAWGASSEQRLPIPWGWFVLIAIAIVVAVIWSLANLKDSKSQALLIRTETESVLAKDEREEAEARQLVESIEASLRSFFKATSVESLARLVRHRERVEPLMHAHYSLHPLGGSPMQSLRVLQPLTLDNHGNFWMASVSLADGRVMNLVIEIDAQGSPLIDWETLVCHQPMAWDDFARQRPASQSMDFRVYVERDNFHSHEFSDSELWLSFRLTALDSDETLFGYVSTSGAEARKLLELTAPDAHGRSSLILRLNIPQGLGSPRGVVIEKVVSPRWLYVNSPDAG